MDIVVVNWRHQLVLAGWMEKKIHERDPKYLGNCVIILSPFYVDKTMFLLKGKRNK